MKKTILVLVSLILSLNVQAQNQPTPKKVNLFDLGISHQPTDPKIEFENQLQLEKRRFYLEQHQKWGLVTLGLMALALTSAGDGNPPIEHVMLGTATAATYGVSAYYAIQAPNWTDFKTNPPAGGSALHRNLAWVHVPGMILTPILGYIAKKKRDKGEDLNSPEKYHKDVAGITAATLAISVLSVSFEF